MYAFFKRVADIFLSLLLGLILSPLLLLIVIVIFIETPGSAVFRQKRAGRNNTPFTIFKFRTMLRSAPDALATREFVKSHEFVTRTGAFLRRTSLDELPQLWNILRGDMSFIGPRPVVMTEVSLLALRAANGAISVRPGITGLAQVRGRDTLSDSQKAKFDAEYAQHPGFFLDMRIIFETLKCIVTGEGIQGQPK